jgi:hypothetical protein
MTFDRSEYKGADILHLKFFRIESEFNDLMRFYEFMDSEIKFESVRLSKLISKPILFDTSDDEDSFYYLVELESDTFNDYLPQVSKKYAFIGMFGLFENYFKNLILISSSRNHCKSILDKNLRKEKIIKLKTIINNSQLHKLKTEFICENRRDNSNFNLFDNFWFELSKLKELRNSIIHNDSDVKKDVEKFWERTKPQIHTLEQFINEFFNDELLIVDNKFLIKDKEFLQRCKSLYLNLLEEMKKIIINNAHS